MTYLGLEVVATRRHGNSMVWVIKVSVGITSHVCCHCKIESAAMINGKCDELQNNHNVVKETDEYEVELCMSSAASSRFDYPHFLPCSSINNEVVQWRI